MHCVSAYRLFKKKKTGKTRDLGFCKEEQMQKGRVAKKKFVSKIRGELGETKKTIHTGEKPRDEGCMETNSRGAQGPWSVMPKTVTVEL